MILISWIQILIMWPWTGKGKSVLDGAEKSFCPRGFLVSREYQLGKDINLQQENQGDSELSQPITLVMINLISILYQMLFWVPGRQDDRAWLLLLSVVGATGERASWKGLTNTKECMTVGGSGDVSEKRWLLTFTLEDALELSRRSNRKQRIPETGSLFIIYSF